MKLSNQFKFTQVTVQDVFEFIKTGIKNGEYQKYKNFTDQELLALAQITKPLIEVHLQIAGRIALQQLENKQQYKATLDKNSYIKSSDNMTVSKA